MLTRGSTSAYTAHAYLSFGFIKMLHVVCSGVPMQYCGTLIDLTTT
jgi:hypothetical protein